MEKRKLFLSVCFLLIIKIICYAQIISTHLLVNTTWQHEKNNKVTRYLDFTKDSIIVSYNYYNETIIYSKPYYLSNNKDEPFNMEKVGTSTSGKYLFLWNLTMKEKEYCEITTLTEDSLVLFFEAKPHYIGAADVYRTFKRVR